MLLWGLRKQEVWQAAIYLKSKGNINTLKLWQDELLLAPPVQGNGLDYWKTVIFFTANWQLGSVGKTWSWRGSALK